MNDKEDFDPEDVKFLANSRFVLVFHTDGACAILVNGWNGMVKRLREEIFGPGKLEYKEHVEQWDGILDQLTRMDDWSRDGRGPFFLRVEIGEDASVSVVRLWDDKEFVQDDGSIAGHHVTDDMVESVEEEVGMGPNAWDTVNVKVLIAACVNGWLKYRYKLPR